MITDKAIALGRYEIGHWRPGAIGYFLARGHSLYQAKSMAKLAGALIRVDHVDNMVVSDGLNILAQRLVGVGIAELSYHSIGTSTTAPALAQHTLVSEVARLQLASRFAVASVAQTSVFYWASECSYNIKEVGLWAGAATGTPNSGTLFSRALYSYDNSGGSVDLTFDYALTLANS
jgi:hypothetical protein